MLTFVLRACDMCSSGTRILVDALREVRHQNSIYAVGMAGRSTNFDFEEIDHIGTHKSQSSFALRMEDMKPHR